MAIPALWRSSTWFDGLLPAVLVRVEHPQIAVVFLSVISSEDIQLLIEQCGCVVFDLRC